MSFNDQNPYEIPGRILSLGIVKTFEPPLKSTRKQLTEVTAKQNELIEKLHGENLSIAKVQHSRELQEMLAKVKTYHAKLCNIKKDIRGLHEKGVKLKKRALKLKELKEKEPVEEVIITKPTNIIPKCL
ncbi:biogenesis of lysosome-related organelles complex 1 subunit 6-like [Anthonomus grandis grandis]|uniref:biogenesis of lysosome-related organelles complex 1 subunit 6-like n=1 Tax=Anthonomus grandis grandis TaxID=2921223 RepID=UPI002165562B|nr:biogenesis of lysosome-related organelles complex 1 subunit 6-like [Anthonomus grandis grandis]